jgi:hypothetical protein
VIGLIGPYSIGWPTIWNGLALLDALEDETEPMEAAE